MLFKEPVKKMNEPTTGLITVETMTGIGLATGHGWRRAFSAAFLKIDQNLKFLIEVK